MLVVCSPHGRPLPCAGKEKEIEVTIKTNDQMIYITSIILDIPSKNSSQSRYMPFSGVEANDDDSTKRFQSKLCEMDIK